MVFRINRLLQTKIDCCAACKQVTRVRFRLYKEDCPLEGWDLCFSCFRTDELTLLRQIGIRQAARTDETVADRLRRVSESQETTTSFPMAA